MSEYSQKKTSKQRTDIILGPYSLETFPGTCKRKFPLNRSCEIIQTNLSELHSLAEKACVKIHVVWHAIKINIQLALIICKCIHRVRTKTAQIPWKIKSNSRENLTHYYLLTCRVVVNIIVWEIGRGETSCLPITRSGSSHVDDMFTAWYCSTNGSCSKKFKWNHM